MSLIQRQKGRPSKTQQLGIQKKLREHYERGTSASFASTKTGINIKTVCHYFNEWTNELKQIEENEFVIRQNREKERCIMNLEYMIDKLYELLEQLEDEIKNYTKEKKPVPKHLFSLKLQTIYRITEFAQQKGALGMTPTLDFDAQESVIRYRENNPIQNLGEPVKYYR